MREQRWMVLSSKLFCMGCGIFLVVSVFRWLSPLVWVLALSLSVAAVVNPLAKRTATHLHLPRKLCAICYVILLLGVIGVTLYFAVLRLWRELCALGEWLSENPGWIEGKISSFSQWLGELSESLPFLSGEALAEKMREWIGEVPDLWRSQLGEGIGGMLRRTPETILAVVVTLFSCFYLSVDGEQIRGELLGLLPPSAQTRWEELSLRLRRGIRR